MERSVWHPYLAKSPLYSVDLTPYKSNHLPPKSRDHAESLVQDYPPVSMGEKKTYRYVLSACLQYAH